MNRGLTSLLLVLVIQCGLIAAVYWPGTNRGYVPPTPMVPFDSERIDVIYVGDEFDNETVLSKIGDMRVYRPKNFLSHVGRICRRDT